jgi:hypothetical protein
MLGDDSPHLPNALLDGNNRCGWPECPLPALFSVVDGKKAFLELYL